MTIAMAPDVDWRVMTDQAEAPADPRLRFLAGMVAAEAGRPEEARTVWQALLVDTPPDAPWRAMLESRLSALP